MSSSKVFFKTTEFIKSKLAKPPNQLFNKLFATN